MNKENCVSIVISTCNRENLLTRSLESVMNQSYKNIEIIVCDDASEDNTESLLKYYMQKDSRIKYIRNEVRSGACVTRNKGINIATGKYITGLDDDDEFSLDRIENFIEHYNEKYAFICSNINVIEKNKSFPLFSNTENKEITMKNILWFNEVGNQIFIETDRIRQVGSFNEGLTSAQDYDLWIRLILKFGTGLRIKECSYIHYKDHDEPRITTSKSKLKGMTDFLSLHEDKMNKSQIAFHEFRVHKWSKNKLLALKIFIKMPLESKVFILMKYLKR